MNPQESEPLSSRPEPDPAVPPANGAAAKGASENTPPAAAELLGDIDAYQRRVEREWDQAKSLYQSRISEIMDDFLKKGVSDPPANGPASAAPAPATDFDSIAARVAKELRAMDARGRQVPAAPPTPLLTGPAPRFALGRRAAAMGLAAVLLVAAAIGLRMPEWTPLPYARTGAIAVSGGKIFVADWFRKTLYVHAVKRGAPILAVETLPVGLVAGVVPEPDALWTLDGLAREILKHAPTADHQVLERFAAPDARPAALMRDGNDLWLAGLESKTIFRLRADDPTEVRDRYDLPLEHVTAMQMSGRRLWVLDGKAREITVFRLQKPLKPLATFDLDPLLRGSTPTGMSLNGKDAWIVTENPSAIARLPISKIKKLRSSDF